MCIYGFNMTLRLQKLLPRKGNSSLCSSVWFALKTMRYVDSPLMLGSPVLTLFPSPLVSGGSDFFITFLKNNLGFCGHVVSSYCMEQ